VRFEFMDFAHSQDWPGEVDGGSEVKPLLRDEHFSVDDTLLQAWAFYASWSGSAARTIRHHHPQAWARVLALQSKAGNAPRVISAASISATRPTALATFQTPC